MSSVRCPSVRPVSQYRLSPMKKSPRGEEIYILLQSLPGHVNVSYPITKSPTLCKSLRSRYDKIAPATDLPPTQ